MDARLERERRDRPGEDVDEIPLRVPREQVTIVDTWSVMGMRGTGSQDFTVDDIVVPVRRSCLSEDPPSETGARN